ncbi:hypothetical protein UFOVP568_38 [uncultured Caudovirales phage]|uniref:Large polyvalent protein associated domain-containing protein n=1 Tax=uncultured Caudovirales phage TaxID=2100421 RepID=A0A6J5MTK6_9CAUD|nr:hypothetical protein UFOVP568_38 [uncultured Caudovirales phage]
MAESFVDDTAGFVDDLAVPSRTPQRPTYNPIGLGRQFFAGMAQTPVDITLGIPGALGSDAAAAQYRLSVDSINNFMGVEDPQWREDLPGFIAREVGSAAVGLPARTVSGAYNLLSNAPDAVRIAARGLEAITPLTLPLTGRNIAINAVGGGLVGAGMQEMQGVEQAARDAEVRQQADAIARARYAGEIPQPPATDTFVDDAAFVDDAPRTFLGRVAPYVAPVALGLGATTGLAVGARSVLADRANRAAQQNIDITQPGRDPNSIVYEPTTAERVIQEGVSDATIFNRTVDDMLDRGTIQPPQAAELRGLASRIFTEAPRYDQIQEALDTGTLPMTGGRFLSKNEFEVPIARMTPQDRAELQAALNIGTELDNRAENLANANMATYNGVRVPARANLWDQDDAALMQRYQQYQQNPAVAAEIQRYRADMDSMLDFMQASGLKDAGAIQAMRQVNPHYVFTQYARDRLAVDNRGSLARTTESNTPLTERTRSDQSGSLRMQDPLIARNEAWRKVIDHAMVNDAIRKLAAEAPSYNAALGATERRTIGRVIAPQAPPRDGFGAVPFLDNGVQRKLEVSAEMLDLMRAAPRASMPVLSGFSNALRSFTTGVFAPIFGSFMAPVSAGMASVATALNRPKGARAGIFDSALQQATGGRIGFKGDVSFVLQTAGQFVADMTAQSSQWAFNGLQRSVLNNGILARQLGQQGATRVLQRLDNYYKNSTLSAMRRSGATGTGLSYDPATRYSLNPGLQALTPELRRQSPLKAPTLDNIRDAGGLVNYVTLLGGKITPVQAQRVWDMYKQTLDIMSGSATSAYFRLNRGQRQLTDTALAGETRALSGDPSAMGSNKIWQGILSTLPYSNIAIQSATQYGRAAKNSPAAFIPGLAIAVGVPTLIHVASALYADKVEIENGRPPKYVAHMLMQNAQQDTGNLSIYIPGVEPQFGFRMTPDQPMMPFVAMAKAVLIEMLGADRPEFWTPEMEPLRDGFIDFMSDRQANSIRSALSTAFTSFNMNPLVGAGIELTTGANVDNLLNLGGPRISIPRDVGAPGFEDRQGSNDPIPRAVRTLVENFMGASSEGILSTIQTGVIASLAEGGEPLAAAMDNLSMLQQGNLRQAAPLLQQQRRLVQRDAVGDILGEKEASMQRLYAGSGDYLRPDTVGAGKAMMGATGVGRQPPPDDMIPLLNEARVLYGSGVLPRLRERRTALQQDILSIENSPEYANNPQRRLEVINERVRDIRSLNQTIYEQVQAFEARQTLQTGRRVRLERLDPQRGLDQFPALQ